MSSIPSTCTVHIVPTKTDDNCSYDASIWRQSIEQEHAKDEVKFDAFQHYSNDLLRLKTLLLSPDQVDGDDDDESSSLIAVNNALRSVGLCDLSLSPSQNKKEKLGSTKRRRGNSSQPIKDGQQHDQERKTRLSWELHPSLLLYDLFDELYSVSDEEGDMREAVSPNVIDEWSVIDFLEVLLTTEEFVVKASHFSLSDFRTRTTCTESWSYDSSMKVKKSIGERNHKRIIRLDHRTEVYLGLG